MLCRLLGPFGLPWQGRSLGPRKVSGPVTTAGVWRVRGPLYQRASGRSEHYREQLATLRAYLAALPPDAAPAP